MKKFCVDGSDGNRKYWHQKRNPLRTKKTRIDGERGVMMWMDMPICGAIPAIEVSHKINSQSYIEVLEDPLLAIRRKKPQKLIFQHKLGFQHNAKLTRT